MNVIELELETVESVEQWDDDELIPQKTGVDEEGDSIL